MFYHGIALYFLIIKKIVYIATNILEHFVSWYCMNWKEIMDTVKIFFKEKTKKGRI